MYLGPSEKSLVNIAISNRSNRSLRADLFRFILGALPAVLIVWGSLLHL